MTIQYQWQWFISSGHSCSWSIFTICGWNYLLYFTLPTSLHFNDHYPGGPCLAGIQNASVLDFIGAKGDGGGGNNWSYKTCKDAVKMSLPTNQHPVFYRPDALPVAQPTLKGITLPSSLVQIFCCHILFNFQLQHNYLLYRVSKCTTFSISCLKQFQSLMSFSLQCFDTAGWATGRASGL